MFPEALYMEARNTGWSYILDRTSQENSRRKVKNSTTQVFTNLTVKKPNTQI